MSSLTRSLLTLLNSPASHRFFTANTTTAKSSLRRLQPATFIFTPSIHSSPNFPKFCTSATKTTNPNPNPTKMDLNYPSNEDFVHIEDPSDSTNNPLTESIVDVANELREEGKEDQYQNQNQNQKEAVSASEVPNQRKELPEELSRSVMVLTCESKADGGSTCDVYLVGTAHVSQESCKLVQAVISYLKPQVVFLELCANRVAVLTPQNLKIPTMGEMVGMWKKSHNTFGILYSWFLAKVANQLEVFPGSEFRVAFEEARKYEGSVILGDRPVQITLQRTWAKMPLWHKVKLLYSLLFQALFLPSSEDLNKMLKEMDDVDMLTLVIQEMSKQFPTLMETLVHERDQYMSSTLLRVAREHTSVVAVVGKGHLQGIKKYWEQPIVMKDLMEIPSDKPAVSALKVLASVGAAVAGVAVISCIFLSRKK